MSLSSTTTIKLNDGVQIPIIGFGTYLAKGDEAYESSLSALKNGYVHIDTAQVYGNEEQVGKAIKDSGIERSKLFITTKLWVSNFSEEKALPSLYEILKKLGLDYIDLILLHAPGIPTQTLEEQKGNPELRKSAWKALEQFHSDGKVKSIGLSNFWPKHIDELLTFSKIKPSINQIEYHAWNQRKLQVDYCRKNGITIESWGSLAQGHILKDETIKKIAEAHKKSIAQVCIRWCLQNDMITIPKSVKEERIIENMTVFDFKLSDDEMKTINNLEKGFLCVEVWEHNNVL